MLLKVLLPLSILDRLKLPIALQSVGFVCDYTGKVHYAQFKTSLTKFHCKKIKSVFPPVKMSLRVMKA